jgi:5-methylcytosine-specific restriction protein A
MEIPFEVGQIYNRRSEIHSVFGGQRQGGIATPTTAPFIILFTGEAGQQHGYSDGWDPGGVFLYTGEGQLGPMQFVRGNRAIRDHALNGKDLLLFEATRKSGQYRFLGRFACANWEIRNAPDTNGQMRDAIVFHLLPEDASGLQESKLPPKPAPPLDELRKLAYAAARPTKGNAGKDAKRSYYERSAAVRQYVLARAAGVCECCKEPAPFRRNDGSPYLEPHHIRRVSDGGPDHPRWVGGICPTCHREIHYGADGKAKNSALQEAVHKAEEGCASGGNREPRDLLG